MTDKYLKRLYTLSDLNIPLKKDEQLLVEKVEDMKNYFSSCKQYPQENGNTLFLLGTGIIAEHSSQQKELYIMSDLSNLEPEDIQALFFVFTELFNLPIDNVVSSKLNSYTYLQIVESIYGKLY